MKILLSALLTIAVTARADIAVNSLVGTPNNASSLGEFTPFTTDGNIWQLDLVTINVFSFEGEAATINLSLYADNSGRPGGFFADAGSQNLSELSIETPYLGVDTLFTPPAAVILQPNTTYWISGTASGPGPDLGWNSVADDSVTTLPGWSLGETEFLYNGVWNSIGGGNETYKLSLQVEAVPEPCVFALLGLAFFLACFFRMKLIVASEKAAPANPIPLAATRFRQ